MGGQREEGPGILVREPTHYGVVKVAHTLELERQPRSLRWHKMTEMSKRSKNNDPNLSGIVGAKEKIKIKMDFKCMCLKRRIKEFGK